MDSKHTKNLVHTSLLAAVVFVTTFAVPIPIGYGYFNLGDAAVFITGLLLGPKYAFFAAGIGSGLSDYAAGYMFYIPSTFILKGTMALLTSKASEKSLKIKIAAMVSGGLIMNIGYYITEGVVYGNWIAPLYNLPWNALQFTLGIIIAMLLYKQLKKFK